MGGLSFGATHGATSCKCRMSRKKKSLVAPGTALPIMES
jgi:hypothetical protein